MKTPLFTNPWPVIVAGALLLAGAGAVAVKIDVDRTREKTALVEQRAERMRAWHAQQAKLTKTLAELDEEKSHREFAKQRADRVASLFARAETAKRQLAEIGARPVAASQEESRARQAELQKVLSESEDVCREMDSMADVEK